jgi:DNA-binding transcriptional LysR family regulator
LAQRANQGEIGHLTVGFNSTVGNSIFPEILRLFRLRFPDVALTLHELVSYRQLEKLRDRKLDVGFVHTHNLHPMNAQDDDLYFMPILKEPLVVALPQTHPLAIQTEVSLKALADEMFILPPPHLVLYNQIVSLCQQVGFSPKKAQEATWMFSVWLQEV